MNKLPIVSKFNENRRIRTKNKRMTCIIPTGNPSDHEIC